MKTKKSKLPLITLIFISILYCSKGYTQKCSNVFYPVKKDASFQYDSFDGNYKYLGKETRTIKEVKTNKTNHSSSATIEINSYNSKNESEFTSVVNYVCGNDGIFIDANNIALPFVDNIYKGDKARDVKRSLSNIQFAGSDNSTSLAYPNVLVEGDVLPPAKGVVTFAMTDGSGEGIIEYEIFDRKIISLDTTLSMANCEWWGDIIQLEEHINIEFFVKFNGISLKIKTLNLKTVSFFKLNTGLVKMFTYDKRNNLIGYRELNNFNIPHQNFQRPVDVNVTYEVPLIPQLTSVSCWAASTAMLVSWRDNVSYDPTSLAAHSGYWDQYHSWGMPAGDINFFNDWGLVPEPGPITYTIEKLRDLLHDYGPLFLSYKPEGRAHASVIKGLVGDGTYSGTYLNINNPWPPEQGDAFDAMSFCDFLEYQKNLNSDSFQILHLKNKKRKR